MLIMRTILRLAAVSAAVLATHSLFAQLVNPDIVGPVRREAAAAANAAGAPGVGQRIENREQRRDVIRADVNGNPNAAVRAEARAADQWRFRYHNNRWWYYTPGNQWMYYSNNAWQSYGPNVYVAPVPRYTTGYRGDNGNYYNNRYNRRWYRGRYGAATTPYSNGTPAGNAGSSLGAEIGAAANGAAGANTGAAIGGAIGNTIGGAANAVPPLPLNAPTPAEPPK
jgi:hypothetical protein